MNLNAKRGKKIVWYSQLKYWIKRKIWQHSDQSVLYPWMYRKAVSYWCYAKRIHKKETQIRGEVYSVWNGTAERIEGKNQDGGTIQRKIKKHGKQELMQKITVRYWTCVELEVKCSRNFFQYSEFVHSSSSRTAKATGNRQLEQGHPLLSRSSPVFTFSMVSPCCSYTPLLDFS